MVFGSIESNLIIRPAAKAESNPFYVPGTLFWPRVVTPDIAALKSVTPTVIDMGLDMEDTTLSPILPPSTTQSPVGSDLSVLILTVLTALCQRKGSADPACVQARSQLRGLSLSKVDNVQEDHVVPDQNEATDENGSVFVGLEHLDEKLNSMIGCSENRLSESYGKIRARVCKVCGKEGSKTNIRQYIILNINNDSLSIIY